VFVQVLASGEKDVAIWVQFDASIALGVTGRGEQAVDEGDDEKGGGEGAHGILLEMVLRGFRSMYNNSTYIDFCQGFGQ